MKNSRTVKNIYVIGIGPGHPDYILPIAKKTINAMDVIVAGKRNQKCLALDNQIVYTIKGPLSHLKDYIDKCPSDQKIGLVVSGDPSFYSLLNWTKMNFETHKIITVPGISSLQYFFTRLNKAYHKSYWVSLHGRENNFIQHIKNHRFVALLTDQINTPKAIAKKLIDNHLTYQMHVGENLSYASETITSGSPEEIIKKDNYKLSVVIIENENYKG
jgi:cobalt-precorrin-7 (C5)-methyltransferase